MRYALLMHHFEPAEGELSEEAMAEGQRAFGVYAKALHEAGVLLSADILSHTPATTTVSRRDGATRVQDGPFAETKEALAGVFVIDVPDLDGAIGWAERCPGAEWGAVEVRPVATSVVNGGWTR
ncbi:YciI family protein [Actinoplanes subglobosus]|uniref:YciI family protein n=1 Tax=Actinoplanes subglobosus TaxID=1547892 RepID=A0ABV8J669_9ACTN